MNDIRPAKERPVIIALPEDTVIGPELIDYCTRRHMADLQRYRRLDRYYMNENEIGNRIFKDGSKPNNRIAHAFARYITCIATAYFLGSGVKIECEDPEYRDALNELYQSHMAEVKHYEEAKGMSKFGRAFELLYIDRDGNDRTASIQPSDMIPVYGDGIDRFLIFVIYLYKTVKIVGGIETAIEHADVYTADRVYTYERRAGTASRWMRTGDYAHGYSDVPVIVRWNSTDQKGDYEDVIPQIDAYDRAQSDTANDLDYFTDAYLAVTGAEEISLDGETNEDPATSLRTMREERLLLLPDGGDVKFVTKNIADTPTENYKNRVYRDLFFLALVPNLTDESFAGNLSGVAMKYKLFGIEELATEKQKYFTSSEMKKIRLLTEHLNARRGTAYDWRTVKLSFDRSNIANLLETSQIINNLRGLLSDETLIGMWPEIKDASDELQRRLDERARAENDEFPSNVEALLTNDE